MSNGVEIARKFTDEWHNTGASDEEFAAALDELLNTAYSDGHTDGYDEGFDQGYDEGSYDVAHGI